MDRWVGRTAVVTGASAGIGAAIAVAIADAGLNVVGLARRPHLVEELNKQITVGKGKIIGKRCDISSSEEIIEVFEAISEQFGGINILINNAGISEMGTLTDAGEKIVSDEAIERVLKTNTLGMVICSREAVKYMKKTGEPGHIVNINSIGGHYVPAALGIPRFNIYYGSKHAVQATSEAMRLEFSHSKANIKITCVSPAGVRTDMTIASAAHKSDPTQDTSPHAPIPAIGLLEAKDIADAVMNVLATPPRVNITAVTIRPTGDTF